MNLIEYPAREEWSLITQRPVFDNTGLQKKVRKILDKVKEKGDKAVKKFTKEFDGISLKKLEVTGKEIKQAEQLLSAELKDAILAAKSNIEKFHKAQLLKEEVIETMPGVQCWRKSVGIEKVGLYIPGGTAPLFSTVLMLAIPARLSGCKEIVLCTPPQQDGKIHPAVLYAADIAGVNKIIKAGGVQAIAAMAYGTETVPQVYKIFGPGNQYVTCAKQIIQSEGVAIDMPAGPSEVCVLADETADASFVAADLLSQAEHGADSQALLVSNSRSLVDEVTKQVQAQLEKLPRKEIALKALQHSKLILVKDLNEGVEFVNAYAPEHLIVACKDDGMIAEKVVNAGSVFLGNYSPESVGDYASGTNHTLPTNGYARSYSGVSIDSFVKKITYQRLTQEGLKNIGQTVVAMAQAEGLDAHANAVTIRLTK
jgi:histidinol dehydrogenase